jgi:hypothetical protein
MVERLNAAYQEAVTRSVRYGVPVNRAAVVAEATAGDPDKLLDLYDELLQQEFDRVRFMAQYPPILRARQQLLHDVEAWLSGVSTASEGAFELASLLEPAFDVQVGTLGEAWQVIRGGGGGA